MRCGTLGSTDATRVKLQRLTLLAADQEKFKGKTERMKRKVTELELKVRNCQEGVVVPVAWQYKPGAPKSYFSYGRGAQKYGWTMRSTRVAASTYTS